MLLNTGSGSFTAATSYTTGRTPFNIALADFDKDGDLDVATANWHHNDVVVLLNTTNNDLPQQDLPPNATPDSAMTPLNTPVVIDILTNDNDVDGSIDPTSVTITTPPQHGSVTVNPTTGAVTYTPTSDYSGADEFFYTVKDNQGNISAPARVSITVNAPPAAVVYLSDLDANLCIQRLGQFRERPQQRRSRRHRWKRDHAQRRDLHQRPGRSRCIRHSLQPRRRRIHRVPRRHRRGR